MTPFPAARALVLSAVEPLGTESVEIDRLHGRVFAQDLVSPFEVPHFDNSQVDGYAIRSQDVGPRRILGVSAAGEPFSGVLQAGEAVRIYTGASLPQGADAVAMQEDARVEGEWVQFEGEFKADTFVRFRGEEVREGAVFETNGLPVTPPLAGLAASFGLEKIRVHRGPRVAIVATGDELVRPGTPLMEGQIYASNPLALEAAIRSMGIEDVVLRLVQDDVEETRRVLAEALQNADVLITTGGVSVGDRDLVRPTLTELGIEERLWRVDMKPGKPFYFGVSLHPRPLSPGGERGAVVFGLPGNPVSALVTFYVLVRPALRKMMGIICLEEETSARLGSPIRRKDVRYEFVRAALSNGVVTPVEAQGSHMQTGLAFANALIHLPSGVAEFSEGENVTVTPLNWG